MRIETIGIKLYILGVLHPIRRDVCLAWRVGYLLAGMVVVFYPCSVVGLMDG